MKELQTIIAKVQEFEPHTPAVLATVVDVRGSSYRLPGAKMLILENGENFGMVSGGCLEADVLERAKQVLKTNEPQVFVYDTTTNDDSVFALNMGCRGVIRILLEPVRRISYLNFVRDCLRFRIPSAVATLVESKTETKIGSRLLFNTDGVAANDFKNIGTAEILSDVYDAFDSQTSCLKTYDFGDVFIEIFKPPLNLVIFGAGADVAPLVEQSKNLGWRVSVVDHRSAFAKRERFPLADEILISRAENFDVEIDENSAAVVMTHNYERDKKILQFLLKSSARYIGALGPKRRTESILRELSDTDEDFTENQLQKLYAPVGLDIGADTPEAIALSIVAEIQAVLAGREGGFLRNRQGSIYNRQTLEK